MLGIPEKDFNRSVTTNNIVTSSLADWLEANLLFSGPSLSKSEIVDLLIEEEICPDGAQSHAHNIATAGWSEIELRQRWCGTSPHIDIQNKRLTGGVEWKDDLVRAFCLLLSLQRIYPGWAKKNQDHSLQGDLFEKVVEVLCAGLLPGWSVIRAGWSPENAVSVSTIVPLLCGHLNTSGCLDLEAWASDAANDGGLDIVCYRKFADAREATPTYLLQCASGANWRTKVHTPNPFEWMKYLNAAALPGAGIVAPFVIDDKDVRRAGLQGQVTVFDRIRLLNAVYCDGVILPAHLSDELILWMEPRIKSLPII